MTIRTTLIRSTALSIALTAGLFGSVVDANTQVRLQSSSEYGSFSEGYALTVEKWSEQTHSNRTAINDGYNNEDYYEPQVWIYDVATVLYNDSDNNGFYSGFSLFIDVDTDFGDTDVVASIFLQPSDGPEILLHETGRFTIYGTSFGDEYQIDTDLRNNFPTNTYNIVIDIHDAWTGEVLDSATRRGFQNLANLPLESDNRNQLSTGGSAPRENGLADVVITETAGFFHPLWLLLLAGVALMRRKKHCCI